PQMIDEHLGDGSSGCQASLEGLELLLVGQIALPQQIHHLFERRVRGQVFDRVTAVDQSPRYAIDRADRRRGGDHIFERSSGCGGRGFLSLSLSGGDLSLSDGG